MDQAALKGQARVAFYHAHKACENLVDATAYDRDDVRVWSSKAKAELELALEQLQDHDTR